MGPLDRVALKETALDRSLSRDAEDRANRAPGARFLAHRAGLLFWIPAFLLTGAFVYQCAIALSSLDRLVRHGTVDDTFLYLEVARNWADLGFPTFDGRTLTNGVQPLWGSILALLAVLVTDQANFLRVAALVCALLNFAAGAVIYRAGSLLGGRLAGAIAAAFWASMMFIPDSISGMESPLHGLVFGSLLVMGIHLLQRPPLLIRRWHVALFGALLALNAFCRLDAAIVSIFIGAPLLIRLALGRRLVHATLLACIPAAAMLAYFGVNQLVFGSAVPVSGLVKFFYVHQAREATGGSVFSETADSFGKIISRNFHWVTGHDFEAPSGLRLTIFRYTARVIALLALAGIVLDLRRRRTPVLLWGLLAGVVLHALVMAAVLQRFAENDLWYYQPLRIVFAITLGYGLSRIVTAAPGRWVHALLLAAGLAAFANAANWGVMHAVSADTGHLYVKRIRAAQWIASTPELDRSARIGSWNAGQLGYFSHPRGIVNLDGLVQDRPFLEEVLRTGEWRRYFERNGIRYLVDFNAADSTQTFALGFDPATSFRGIVPLERTRLIKKFGMVQVVDISPWLAETAPE